MYNMGTSVKSEIVTINVTPYLAQLPCSVARRIYPTAPNAASAIAKSPRICTRSEAQRMQREMTHAAR
jgi:hypothetical protein